MSLSSMKVGELKEIADQLGVDIDPKANKQEIITELEESGVTFDYIEKLRKISEENQPTEDELAESKPKTFDVDDETIEASQHYENQKLLLKLVGPNSSIEAFGFKFTQSNPFNIMSGKDAQEIIDFFPDKFRIASPREAKEFYA